MFCRCHIVDGSGLRHGGEYDPVCGGRPLDLLPSVRFLQDHALGSLHGLPAQEVVHGPAVGNPRRLVLLAQHNTPVSCLPYIGGGLDQRQGRPVFYDPIHGFTSSVFLPLMNRA